MWRFVGPDVREAIRARPSLAVKVSRGAIAGDTCLDGRAGGLEVIIPRGVAREVDELRIGAYRPGGRVAVLKRNVVVGFAAA